MSELINTHDSRATIRWKLLTGVSALALTAAVSATSMARAEDADRPPLWIELGGGLQQIEGGQTAWISDFENAPGSVTGGSEQPDLQRQSKFDFNLDGKISFEPAGTDWILSAGINYGRGHREKQFHVTNPLNITYDYSFLDTRARSTENHTILDFQVGKDVGLGMLGAHSRSTFSVGLRIAQFKADVHDFATSSPQPTTFKQIRYNGEAKIDRETSAFGPSLAWDGSTLIAGSLDAGLSLDWGVNGAILFARQKARAHLSTHYEYQFSVVYVYRTETSNPARAKRVIVPNVGGFAGVSWRLPNAKISLGYRADMFFGAIDGGIDAAKKENRSFYGPFASISIGIGD